jgi:hypothetical protein
MAVPLSWIDAIDSGDLGSAPTALTDPNVVETAELGEVVALSSEMTGGTSPTMTVTVYYWDELATAFYLSGDQFILDPANANLAVMNPNGLKLGFTAVLAGAPATAVLNVGRR